MTIKPIESRPLSGSEHAAWLPLWRGYQAFYKTDIPAEVSAITWSRLLNPLEPMGAALAWDGTRAVGLVHHVRHRSCWTIGDYLYLQDLFVSPEVRGAGIGRRLIEYVYDLARAQGCSRDALADARDQHRCHGAVDDRVARQRSASSRYRRSIDLEVLGPRA